MEKYPLTWVSKDIHILFEDVDELFTRQYVDFLKNNVLIVDWHFLWCGIGLGTYSTPHADMTLFVVPYWSILLPLTLLSGCLLLRKPRVANAPESSK